MALQAGEARLCPAVKLELWNGARGLHERKVLEEILRAVPELDMDENVWHESYELARKARLSGVTIPAVDVLIAACALYHGAKLETSDTDFELLQSVASEKAHRSME